MEYKILSKSILKSYLPENSQSSYGDIVDLYYREIGDYTDGEFLELNSEEIDELKETLSKFYDLPNITFNDVYVLNHIIRNKLNNDTEDRKGLRYAIRNGSLNYVKNYLNELKDKKTISSSIDQALYTSIKHNQFDIVEFLIALRYYREYRHGFLIHNLIPFDYIGSKTSAKMKEFLLQLDEYYKKLQNISQKQETNLRGYGIDT